MASFPGTVVSLTNPSGTSLVSGPIDHALLHGSVNNEVTAIEGFLGTNSATNVFAGYKSGWVPLAVNGGTLQGVVAKGTFNNGILGTPSITGGTANSQTLNGQGTNSGTIINGVYNNATLGTPIINVWNGWIQANEIATVLGTTSAQGINIGTLTVQATASNKYDKGDKLQFTQGGSTLCAYVYSVPSGTTLLATGGTTYVIGTTAITNFQYSKSTNPNGFPDWLDYTSGVNYTGTAPTGLTTTTSQFKIDGHEVRYRFHVSYGTAGTTTGVFINQPIPSNITGNIFHDPAMGLLSSADDTNAPNGVPFECTLAGGTTIQMQYGNNATKAVWIQGNYAI